MVNDADGTMLSRLYGNLTQKDWFMTMPDFESYCATKAEMLVAHENERVWARSCLVNIAQAGYFSSDRTIRQYNEDIWHL